MKSKNIFFSCILLLCMMSFSAQNIHAQAMKSINYQAVARDAGGLALANKTIGVRLAIRSGSSTGTVQYAETQVVTTNAYGLYTLKIGKGSILAGSFSAIPWANGNQWLEIEVDVNGGSNYLPAGASELLTVPYALYAETSGSGGGQGVTGPTGLQGATGSAGPAGPQGPAGLDGMNGVNGLNGLNGQPGPTGPTGTPGNNGIGIQGATGPTGATGSAGPTGPAGFSGVNGTNNTLVKFTSGNTVGDSQVFDNGTSVGFNTTTPDKSAIVDMSSNNQGVLFPRLTEDERDSIKNPALGLMIINTSTSCINMWTGSTWKQACFECAFNPPVATNNGPVCKGASIKLFATTIPNASYSWTGPNGFVSNQQNPVITNASLVNKGDYQVVASVGGCSANPSVTSVNVSSISSISFSNSPANIDMRQSVVFSPSITSGVTYNWLFTSANPASSTAMNPSVVWNTSGSYGVSLTVTELGCSYTTNTTVTVNHVNTTITLNSTGTGSTGTIQSFTVPAGITSLTIEAWGAQGGQGTSYTQYTPGKGAYMKGDFVVTPGQVLKVLVGQLGPSGTNDGGGGGGSFVVTNSNNPLIIAGGGGGSSYSGSGSDAVTTNNANPGVNGGSGGSGGGGGSSAGCSGAGGGFSSDGGNGPSCGSSCNGGKAFLNGGDGGCTVSSCTGGFGGGGGTHGGGWGGGGGGGYSGGGASTSSQYGGGGGGSYNSGTNQTNTPGVKTGDGKVTITY